MSVFDCRADDSRAEGLTAATRVLGRGELVVLPTDTVYGIGANAFDPGAVAALLAAKKRERSQPPPVLVPSQQTLTALTAEVPPVVERLIEAFWPGPLTVICRAQSTLAWDLGDTAGTVALRMPDHEVALELLATTGPLAVSSANISQQPAATTVLEAAAAFGASVSVYLDDGPSVGGVASTIVDATGPRPRIVRDGAIGRDELLAVAPELAEEDSERAGDDPELAERLGQEGEGAPTEAPSTDGNVTAGSAADEDAAERDVTDGNSIDGNSTDGRPPPKGVAEE